MWKIMKFLKYFIKLRIVWATVSLHKIKRTTYIHVARVHWFNVAVTNASLARTRLIFTELQVSCVEMTTAYNVRDTRGRRELYKVVGTEQRLTYAHTRTRCQVWCKGRTMRVATLPEPGNKWTRLKRRPELKSVSFRRRTRRLETRCEGARVAAKHPFVKMFGSRSTRTFQLSTAFGSLN